MLESIFSFGKYGREQWPGSGQTSWAADRWLQAHCGFVKNDCASLRSLAEPRSDFGGVLVGRKDGIEDVLDDGVARDEA